MENNSIRYALGKGTKLQYVPSILEKAQGKKECVYTIEKTLGQGGFGITYLASHVIRIGNTKHRLLFAIKEFFVKGQCWREKGESRMLLPEEEESKARVLEYLEDFVNEAHRLNRICNENANIVKVNEVFRANATAYYVMEYIDGCNLKMLVRDQGPLPEAKALSLLLPIAKAVDFLHTQHELLHCDIKHENIMLQEKNGLTVPVLIDFGESRHFKDGSLTTTHQSVGVSKGFAPIEQYDDVSFFMPQIDVYALAATLFYLLTGHVPVVSFEISAAYIEKCLPQDISQNVREGIVHGMEKLWENRTPSVSLFISELYGEDDASPMEPQSESKPEIQESYFIQNMKDDAYQYWTETKDSLHAYLDQMRASFSQLPERIGNEGNRALLKKCLATIIILTGVLILGVLLWKNIVASYEKPDAALELKSEQIASVSTEDIKGAAIEKENNLHPILDSLINDMVVVEGGSFTMGSENKLAFDREKPSHQQNVNTFCISKHEITQEIWDYVMGNNPSKFKGQKRPVERVSWNDCQHFLNKLNEMTSRHFRLPTEAEWEYAARGGNKSGGYEYAGSAIIVDVAWYSENSDSYTHEIGKKAPNELGLYDMTGNVWELCQDTYHDYHQEKSSNSDSIVGRGGGFGHYDRWCRVSARQRFAKDEKLKSLGFRIAQSIE